MIDDFLVADVDLALFDERRHRDDDGEFLRIAFEVVHHGDHGLVVVADEHDLRRLVENFRVGLGDVKAAEAVR